MAAGSPPSPAARTATTSPPSARVTLVAGARLPLAFIGVGLAALALAASALLMRPELLLLPFPHPHVVALAHLWLPGFLLSVCVGAIYQLMPVVLGAALRSPLPAIWTHFALHAVGTGLLVAGFSFGRFEIVATGGVAVTAGSVVLLAAAWRTFRASARRDAVAWSFPLAVSWLAATTLLGVVLAANRHAPFLPLGILELLKAHAHLGLAGFFLTLLQGATFQLVPMFTLADPGRPGAVRAGLALNQAGLLALTPALAWAQPLMAVLGALLITAGIGCSAVALLTTLQSRRRRTLEPGLKAFVLGASFLPLSAIAGVALLLAPSELLALPRATMACGVAIIVGALPLMVLGMLYKIVPFLVWMKTYGPRAGRQPIPTAAALASPTLERAWLVIHLVALVVLLVAVPADSLRGVACAAVLLAAAITLFLANMLRVLRHLWLAGTIPTVTPPVWRRSPS